MCSFSPIQGTMSWLVLKFHVTRIWELDLSNFTLSLLAHIYGTLEKWSVPSPHNLCLVATGTLQCKDPCVDNLFMKSYPTHCEPEGGLLSKGCSASQKHSWKHTEYQYMIHGNHSPGQQFSLSLVKAKMAGADSLCPKVVNSCSRDGFHAEMIWYSE